MRKRPNQKGYAEWHKKVLIRDNYVCKICGKKVEICKQCGKKESLDVHHILPYRYFPKYKYTIKNGITLCKRCHHRVPKNIEKVFKKVNVDLILK